MVHRGLRQPMNSSQRLQPIAVVGGGLAGIAASLTLADAGHPVVLLEARRRLGGRAGSFFDESTQQSFDYCQHVGMECCHHLRWLIERLGQRPKWRVEDRLWFFLKAAPLPPPLHLAGMLWKWPSLRWQDRLAIALASLRLWSFHDPIRADSMLAIDWLKANHQTSRSLTAFWEPILVSALGEQLPRVTLAAARKVLVDGFLKQRLGYRLWIPQVPLAELFDEEAQTILRRAGVDVRLQTPVQSLLWDEGLATGLQIQDQPLEVNAIVLAVPWHAIGRILSDSPGQPGFPDAIAPSWEQGMQAASSLQSSPITGIHLWFDRPWLNAPHAILIGGLCQWIFPGPLGPSAASNQQQSPWYAQVVISGSRQLPKGDSQWILKEVMEEIHRMFPDARAAQLLKARVVTDPQAVFSMQPGHQSMRWKSDRFASQRLWVAGDWTDTGWPATMEGAILSGRQAARQLLQSLGTPSNDGSTGLGNATA
jgi:squalene-associated FAD-dependent desaturase